MAGVSQVGRRSTVGLVSTLAWLSLFIAVASTAASLTVGSLNHVGTSASMLVKDISEKPSTINSIIDEFKKNADPKTVAEIEPNFPSYSEWIEQCEGGLQQDRIVGGEQGQRGL